MRRYWQSLYDPESPVRRRVNFLCSLLVTVITVAGVIIFVLWMRLRPHRPKFDVVNLNIIPNAKAHHYGLANLSVQFAVREHNPNQKIGIHYDEIHALVLYGDQVVATGPVRSPFYEVPKGDTVMHATLTATGPVPTDPSWGQFAYDLNYFAIMLLVLTSNVQFQENLWDSNHHHMKVKCYFYLYRNGTSYENPCVLYF